MRWYRESNKMLRALLPLHSDGQRAIDLNEFWGDEYDIERWPRFLIFSENEDVDPGINHFYPMTKTFFTFELT